MHLLKLALCTLILTLCGSTVDASPGGGETDTLLAGKVNQTDIKGFRQGYWKITGAMVHDNSFKKGQVVEEGPYMDNKRNGVWKKYYPTGTLRSEITFVNNHPRGTYTIYFPNGKMEETGDWQGNRNVGPYVRFHANGKPSQEFTFNEYGKRDGLQRYYHENGQLHMSVEIDNGVAHGVMKVYYSNGELRSEKRLVNGKVEEGSQKEYEPTKRVTNKTVEPELPIEETKPQYEDRPNLVEFKDTGFNTLYNRSQQITQVGEFKNGRLWNGKWHRYDADGILRKVEVYREGRFAGYGVIDNSTK